VLREEGAVQFIAVSQSLQTVLEKGEESKTSFKKAETSEVDP
jgi:hypothetical protein